VDEHEEDTQVAKKGHTEEQILRALRQAEGGTRVVDIWREHGISEATGPLLLRLLMVSAQYTSRMTGVQTSLRPNSFR
jgi:transposase